MFNDRGINYRSSYQTNVCLEIIIRIHQYLILTKHLPELQAAKNPCDHVLTNSQKLRKKDHQKFECHPFKIQIQTVPGLPSFL